MPLYAGALALARAGIASTLLPENLALASLLRGEVDAATAALLFDPQTAGGLLAGVPADARRPAWRRCGRTDYVHAAIVGRVRGAVRSARDVSIAVERR